jgi:hypothetical protein
MAGLQVKTEQIKLKNAIVWLDYFHRLQLMALSMFEWVNMPPLLSVRYLEKSLFETGKAAFIFDKTYGYMGLRCSTQDRLNPYGEPLKIRVFGENGYNKEFNLFEDEKPLEDTPAAAVVALTDTGTEKAVMIKNNYLMLPTIQSICLFCDRLYEIERSLDINIKLQKIPLVMVGSDRSILSLKAFMEKVDGNSHVIYVDTSMNLEGIKALKTDAPFLCDKLMEYKHDVWNEALSFLGVNNNPSVDKAERLLTDEVQSNNELIQLSSEIMLICRREACQEINKMFGLNIDVKLRGRPEPGAEPEPGKPEPDAETGDSENG